MPKPFVPEWIEILFQWNLNNQWKMTYLVDQLMQSVKWWGMKLRRIKIENCEFWTTRKSIFFWKCDQENTKIVFTHSISFEKPQIESRKLDPIVMKAIISENATSGWIIFLILFVYRRIDYSILMDKKNVLTTSWQISRLR